MAANLTSLSDEDHAGLKHTFALGSDMRKIARERYSPPCITALIEGASVPCGAATCSVIDTDVFFPVFN